MISVITVDFYSGVFLDILRDSLKKNADPSIPYELIVHDNGAVRNIGHGKGIEELVKKANYNTILLLDSDAHVILKDWNRHLLALWNPAEQPKKPLRLIAGEGGQLKPVRPCVMSFERDYVLSDPDFTFQSQEFLGAKFDVGVLFNFQVLSKGGSVQLFKYAKKSYPNTVGNDFLIQTEEGNVPFVFHHWYGSRWYDGNGNRVRDKVDSLTWEKLEASRDELVKQYGL